MKRAAGVGLKIEVLVESDQWQNASSAKALMALMRRALARAAIMLCAKPVEVAIVLTDDAAMRTLNRNWRRIDAATNVLAFPTRNVARRILLGRRLADRVNDNQLGNRFGPDLCNHLGDIVLAYETIDREARRGGKPFDHHLTHLAVHGFLHLLGYDHLNDAQARRMETTERTILRDLAVPDPYRATRSTLQRPVQRAAKRPGGRRARAAENA